MKITNKVLCVVATLLVYLGAANAQENNTDNNALSQLVEKLSKITTFSGTFIQYAVDQKGARVNESHGELKADRSGLFYWHTSEPLEQTVISNGTEVTVYDPDLEQATIQTVGQQVQSTPAILFSGDTDKIGEMFNVEIKTQVAQSVQYALKPKNKESLFERLTIRFEGEKLQ